MTPTVGVPAWRRGDQRRPQRQAGDEGAGAVDGVQHPDMVRLGTVGAVFLADDAVVGIAFGDQAAHGRLGLFVGLGDGIEAGRAALVLMPDVRAEERQGDARGFGAPVRWRRLRIRSWGSLNPLSPVWAPRMRLRAGDCRNEGTWPGPAGAAGAVRPTDNRPGSGPGVSLREKTSPPLIGAASLFRASARPS